MTRTLTVGIAVVLAISAAATGWRLHEPRAVPSAQAQVPLATAAVVRTDLASTTQLSGTLGYADTYSVVSQLAGTITALPSIGTTISRGQHAFEVDGLGVYLFYGSRPAWRSFDIGMTDGADVAELEQNLNALGFGPELQVETTFTWSADQAVRNWQYATGQAVTGRIDFGRVSFQPGAMRVVSEPAVLGGLAQPGQPVIDASSPQPEVTVQVPPAQSYLVHSGDRVTVTLPSGAVTPGRVSSVSSIATRAAGPNDSNQGGTNGPGNQASIPALVTLDSPRTVGDLDQAPVTINVTDRHVTAVLAVPVLALVALAGGGYGVWVDGSGGRQLVGVTPGLFANTLVQVSSPASSPQLRPGMRVEVPQS